jgi:hypothetical protein
MSYTTIPSTSIQVGKSVTKNLWDLVKGNLDDHETRITALSVSAGPVVIFDEEILNVSTALPLTNIADFRAFAGMNITKAQIQIYTKDGITTGLLEYDLKKASTLGGTYTSIFTTKPAINYATDSTYTSRDGVLNSGQTLAIDDIIRLDITNVPTGVITRFRIMVYGVLT